MATVASGPALGGTVGPALEAPSSRPPSPRQAPPPEPAVGPARHGVTPGQARRGPGTGPVHPALSAPAARSEGPAPPSGRHAHVPGRPRRQQSRRHRHGPRRARPCRPADGPPTGGARHARAAEPVRVRGQRTRRVSRPGHRASRAAETRQPRQPRPTKPSEPVETDPPCRRTAPAGRDRAPGLAPGRRCRQRRVHCRTRPRATDRPTGGDGASRRRPATPQPEDAGHGQVRRSTRGHEAPAAGRTTPQPPRARTDRPTGGDQAPRARPAGTRGPRARAMSVADNGIRHTTPERRMPGRPARA